MFRKLMRGIFAALFVCASAVSFSADPLDLNTYTGLGRMLTGNEVDQNWIDIESSVNDIISEIGDLDSALGGLGTAAHENIGTSGNSVPKLNTANSWGQNNQFFAGLMIGESSPQIKFKKLTGTTNAAEGGTTNIAHGVTPAKILGVSVFVDAGSNAHYPPQSTSFTGTQYDFRIANTNIAIINHATQSENIVSKPVRVLIVYEE